LSGDEIILTEDPSKKQSESEDETIDDSFDSSYSEEIKEHLDKVNMDPWYYIYTNYVNPASKKK
jgi:hypothetical protein